MLFCVTPRGQTCIAVVKPAVGAESNTVNKNVEPAKYVGPRTATVENFPIHEPWPFHLGEQCIFVMAEPTREGCRVWGEWMPEDASPDGFLLARLDYQVAGDVDRLMVAISPILECWMRTRDDKDLGQDLMRSASLLCFLLERCQTEQAHDWFERQWLGYETNRMSQEGDQS